MFLNSGGSEGKSSHQSGQADIKGISEGVSEHVSIIEIGTSVTEDDIPQGTVVADGDSSRESVPSAKGPDNEETAICCDSESQRFNSGAVSEDQDGFVGGPSKELRIMRSGKCQAISWSDKVSCVDAELLRSGGQLDAKDVRKDKCGHFPISNADPNGKGVFDSRESQVNLDGPRSFLEILMEGKNVPLDTTVSMDSRPDWLDQEKLERGRKFAVSNLLAVVYAEMLSLAFLLTMRGSLQALIFTGKSHTPLTAFKRYISTVLRVISWYDDDMWRGENEAWKNMEMVRKMHASVSRRMNSCDREELSRQTTLEGRGIGMLSSPENPFQTDHKESTSKVTGGCPFLEATSMSRGGSGGGGTVHLNQMELSITQFGFMGLVVIYPEKFGLYGASEEDFEGFIHLWRALGHYLGIKDRYNFCSGNLQETRERCRLILDKTVKPAFSEATREWEHMYRCVVEGTRYYVIFNTYGGSLLYLSWLLGVETPRLLAASNWFERFLFKFQKITFGYLCKMYWVTALTKFLLRISLWRGRKLSTVWFDSLEKKARCTYEKLEKGISTRL